MHGNAISIHSKMGSFIQAVQTTFVSLFTLVNELEQIRWQAFVPTKSLVHVEGGLEEMVKSLESYGLPLPILGFTDNVASDQATFMRCIPSLAKDVEIISLDEFSKLPRAVLPESVTIQQCKSSIEIQTACDIEWEFSTGRTGTGPQKTALITIARPSIVYLMKVFHLTKLPTSLITILNSM